MIRATSRLQPLVPASLFQLLIPLFSAVVLATTHAAEPAAPNSLADLQQRITSRISEPRFASALWGVKVASLDSGNTLYEHNAQKLFSPASNSKLYTVALALTRLGPDFRIKTSLYSQARPGPDGKLSGDLVVFGRGDPTICARLHKDDIYAALEPLVDVLTKAGVKEVSGNLVADDSFIHGAPWGSGWDWGDAENYYGAEISALTINDNCLEIRVQPGSPGDPCVLALAPPSDYLKLVNETHTAEKGASRRIRLFRPLESNTVYVSGQLPEGGGIYTDDVTCHQPAGLFLSFLKQAMERHGIRVDGTLVVSDPENPGMKPLDISPLMELGHMESPPMTEIARDILKPSQNLYADLVLAQVGEHSRTRETPARVTSEELGIHELRDFMQQIGVARGDVQFEEGSGLSRNNLTTPRATCALLAYMSHQPYGAAYRDALPIAGVDGTLRKRMKGTPAEGNVRAKTGTLRWAISLSGYVTTAVGEHLVFSMMLNRFQSAASGRDDLDAIASLLASYRGPVGK